MSSRPEILLDVDGVLANFIAGYLQVIETELGKTFTADQVTHHRIDKALDLSAKEVARCAAVISRGGFCSSLEVYPDARMLVQMLECLGDVHIVTSPWDSCPTWTHERTAWLQTNFGIGPDRITHTHAKWRVRGDFLIDDLTSHCTSWRNKHAGWAIRWATPYNRDEPYSGFTLGSYQEVYNFIQERL